MPIHSFITHTHATAIYDTTWRRRSMEEGKRVRVRGGGGVYACYNCCRISLIRWEYSIKAGNGSLGMGSGVRYVSDGGLNQRG